MYKSLLARLQPANSSESLTGAGLTLPSTGPEALLQRGLSMLGVPQGSLPLGALTMPWSVTLN